MSTSTVSAPGESMTEGKILPQLLALFFPILFGTFFQQLYNTADAMIVGRFIGKEALGAVGGSTGALLSIIVNLFVGLSSGTMVVVAQAYGARCAQDVDKAVHTSMALSLYGGIVLTAVSLLVSRPSLAALDTPADIMPHALTYMRIVLLGVTPSFVYNMGAGILRAAGDTRRPVYHLIIACLCNIVLDVLFVAVFRMGISGAAWATILSQLLSAVLVVRALIKSRDSYRFSPSRMRFTAGALRRVFALGIPAGLQSNMYAIANILIQLGINSFGTDAVAAFTASSKVDSFVWMVLGAYSVAATTFAGQNYGARRFDRVRKSVRISLALSSVTVALISAAFYFGAMPLLRIFTDDAAVLSIAYDILRFMSPFYVTYVCVDILSGVIRGCGVSFAPMVITICGICVLRILWILLVVPLRHELLTLLFSFPLTWIVTCIAFILYYRHGKWLRDPAAVRA